MIRDVASLDKAQETMALLNILALGNRQIDEGKVVSAPDLIHRESVAPPGNSEQVGDAECHQRAGAQRQPEQA